MGHMGQTSTSRLYELLVKEKDIEGREETQNKNSFKRVRQTISERWKTSFKLKPKKTKSERAKQKQKRFSLNFYFSDRDSAYYSLFPSQWNPLEFSCESEINKNGFSTISLPKVSSYKNISGLFQRSCKKSKIWNEEDHCKSLPTDRP